MTNTGGTWDPTDRQVIFVAAGPGVLEDAAHNKYVLVAVNELGADKSIEQIGRWFKEGRRILLDSGIYSLAITHAKEHDCSMNEALSLAPKDIDGFSELLDRYLSLAAVYGEQCWGYIEMDQGGRENKKKTRAMLEARGLSPIPVYHPLNDGWDYFDELAQNYDRICLGNIVLASQKTRVRILTTILKRKQAYPNLWIHGLGLAPCQMVMSLPLDSIDASTWLWPLRWPNWPVTAAMKKCVRMPADYYYRLDGEGESAEARHDLTRLLGFDIVAHQRNWRRHVRQELHAV